jgi:hypothetical protein
LQTCRRVLRRHELLWVSSRVPPGLYLSLSPMAAVEGDGRKTLPGRN